MKPMPLLIISLAWSSIAGCKSEKTTAVEDSERQTMENPHDDQRGDVHEARVTSKDGTKIAFEKTGKGPAVILVSGALSHAPRGTQDTRRPNASSRGQRRGTAFDRVLHAV
jgi:hypothetical protein